MKEDNSPWVCASAIVKERRDLLPLVAINLKGDLYENTINTINTTTYNRIH
jgi:hypothetical protein